MWYWDIILSWYDRSSIAFPTISDLSRRETHLRRISFSKQGHYFDDVYYLAGLVFMDVNELLKNERAFLEIFQILILVDSLNWINSQSYHWLHYNTLRVFLSLFRIIHSQCSLSQLVENATKTHIQGVSLLILETSEDDKTPKNKRPLLYKLISINAWFSRYKVLKFCQKRLVF